MPGPSCSQSHALAFSGVEQESIHGRCPLISSSAKVTASAVAQLLGEQLQITLHLPQALSTFSTVTCGSGWWQIPMLTC